MFDYTKWANEQSEAGMSRIDSKKLAALREAGFMITLAPTPSQ